MTEDLKKRIDALREEIDRAEGAERAEALAHLEEAVLQLEAHGHAPPGWAKARIAESLDEQVEDQFDNMPV
jgi:hypothetical protein